MLLGLGCTYHHDCDCALSGDKVEFYLLQSYQSTPVDHFAISNPKIENEPFIRFNEIENYEDATYQFTLKQSAINRIKPLFEPKAFSVAVDRKIIYTGYFRQSFLSSSCNCIRIDPQSYLLDNNKIWIELGYAPSRDLSDMDNRNDPVLLATLARAGKLK